MSLGVGTFAAAGSSEPVILTLTNISATVMTGKLTIPSGALPGDIAVFCQYAYNSSGGAPGTVDFPGATTVVNTIGGAGNRARCICSHKILTAADINVPLAAMTGAAAQKTVRIIRPSRPASSIATGSPVGHSGSSSFLETISTPTGAPAFLFGRVLNSQSALAVQGSLPSNGVVMNEAINSNYRTWVEIQNGPTLTSRTLGSTNSTGLLIGQGYYGVVS